MPPGSRALNPASIRVTTSAITRTGRVSVFTTTLRDGFEIRLLEERHAAEMFAAIERNRDHLRQWLPWVDATRTEDDGLAFIRSSLELFAAHQGFAAALWHRNRVAGVVGPQR